MAVRQVSTPRPGMFDFKGKAKWDAWAVEKDKPRLTAMMDYVDLLSELVPDFVVPQPSGEPLKVRLPKTRRLGLGLGLGLGLELGLGLGLVSSHVKQNDPHPDDRFVRLLDWSS